MNLTHIFNNKFKSFSRLSITLSLAFSLPFSIYNNQAIFAETIIAQNQNIQKDSNYSQIIYVDPRNGNDQNGTGNLRSHSGSARSPFKTITQALLIAKPNSLISLASGTYNEQSGENFPLIVKNEVTIQGNANLKGKNTVIEGNGFFVSPTAAGQNAAIVMMGKAKGVIGVTVINPDNRGHGIWIESANSTISYNTLTRNGNTGVSVNGNSNPTISNNYFFNNNGNGLLVYGTSKPRVENNEFYRTGFGVSAVQNSALFLKGNTFRDNRIGVILEGNSTAILRKNNIIGSTEVGLMTIAQANADLGYNRQTGGNIFRSNRQLDIKNGSTNQIITAFGNQISGKTEGNINLNPTNPSVNIAFFDNNVQENSQPRQNTEVINNQNQAINRQPNNNSSRSKTPVNNNSLSSISNQNRNSSLSLSQNPSTGRVIDITAPTTSNNSQVQSNQSIVNNNNNNNNNLRAKIPPLPTKQPATGIIAVNGNSTPPSPNSTGNAIASNRKLPTPPTISEPYRKNDDNDSSQIASNSANIYNSSNTISNSNVNSSSTNNNNVTRTTSINNRTSPPSNLNTSNTSNQPRYGNSNTQRRNLADILVVAPNALSSNPPAGFNSQNTTSPNYNPSATNSRSNVYKVIVEAKYGYQESQIRSLYPDAFRTNYNGLSMLQVGVFSTQERANQVLESLRKIGLNPLTIKN